MTVEHLTEAKVKAHRCPDGKKQEELVDASRTGLYLLTTKNGSKTYMLRFKSPVTGKTAHIKIGRVEDISLAEAREKVTELRKLITQDIDPRYHREEKTGSEITFPVFFNQHYLPYSKTQKRTWAKDKEIFEIRLKHEFKGPL